MEYERKKEVRRREDGKSIKEMMVLKWEDLRSLHIPLRLPQSKSSPRHHLSFSILTTDNLLNGVANSIDATDAMGFSFIKAINQLKFIPAPLPHIPNP